LQLFTTKTIDDDVYTMGIDETNAAFDQLDGSLNDLEAALAPLLARPLEETLASLPGPVERAKVLFWVAYTIHSCSWGSCSFPSFLRHCFIISVWCFAQYMLKRKEPTSNLMEYSMSLCVASRAPCGS
jgi:hypothetical protein